MNPKNRFKLTRQAMFLATISAAFPVTGYCAAGRVDFAIGNVESVTSTGTRHPLSKGAEINVGETISTSAGARAQVRFTDGGFISLQPNTKFRVDEFNYKNKTDGEEKGFFSLLKGGFRAITGAIGHANKNTYRVKTPAATLGIRGTGYNMVLRDDGLFVNVGEGAISLSNNAGLLVVTAGGAAFVANANTAPVPTNEQPHTPPAGLQEPTFTVADNRDSSGNLALISLPSGPGYTMVDAYTTASTFGINLVTGVNTVFSGSSQLVQYSYTLSTLQTGALGAATVSFSATDGIIGWGRWDGGPTTGTTPQPMTGTFDYVIGIPTPIASLPASANYTLMGYTSPTATNGSITPYIVDGTLSANFVAGTLGVNINITNGTYAYSMNNMANPIIAISGSNFSGFINTTSSTSSCPSSCPTTINGFFAGTNASRAGLSYTISSAGGGSLQGVAAFAKN
ncbi:MAG: FecR family protein [Sideroxyarcus sp.]